MLSCMMAQPDRGYRPLLSWDYTTWIKTQSVIVKSWRNADVSKGLKNGGEEDLYQRDRLLSPDSQSGVIVADL
ncbi:hypothetical protein CW304_02690 [Bacillus sp. UFRGS-B20]|nr:hypothetical protein CW304_02690 [Bacillus sp. UFRGS-B20]